MKSGKRWTMNAIRVEAFRDLFFVAMWCNMEKLGWITRIESINQMSKLWKGAWNEKFYIFTLVFVLCRVFKDKVLRNAYPVSFFNQISFRWKTFVSWNFLWGFKHFARIKILLVSSFCFDSWNCATVLGLVFFACHYFLHATPQSKSEKQWWVENRSRRSVSKKEEEWNSTGTVPYDRTMAITSTRSPHAIT